MNTNSIEYSWNLLMVANSYDAGPAHTLNLCFISVILCAHIFSLRPEKVVSGRLMLVE